MWPITIVLCSILICDNRNIAIVYLAQQGLNIHSSHYRKFNARFSDKCLRAFPMAFNFLFFISLKVKKSGHNSAYIHSTLTYSYVGASLQCSKCALKHVCDYSRALGEKVCTSLNTFRTCTLGRTLQAWRPLAHRPRQAVMRGNGQVMPQHRGSHKLHLQGMGAGQWAVFPLLCGTWGWCTFWLTPSDSTGAGRGWWGGEMEAGTGKTGHGENGTVWERNMGDLACSLLGRDGMNEGGLCHFLTPFLDFSPEI